MKFIFIRHGQTHFNAIHIKQGWCDSPLSPLGNQQVERISELLASYPITKAYTSTLGRAIETMKIVLKHHDLFIHYEERLKEIHFGINEGINDDYERKLQVEDVDWLNNLQMDYRPYHGENMDDVIARQLEAVQEIIDSSDDSDCIVITGHGCSLYALMRTLLPRQQALSFPKNAQANILNYNGKWSLEKIIDPEI